MAKERAKPTPELFRRNTWWQDATGQRKFLMIGIDYIESRKENFVDIWEVGKDRSKYVRFETFLELVESKSLNHFSLEQPYKSYLND